VCGYDAIKTACAGIDDIFPCMEYPYPWQVARSRWPLILVVKDVAVLLHILIFDVRCESKGRLSTSENVTTPKGCANIIRWSSWAHGH
jgi:hypothetical protein